MSNKAIVLCNYISKYRNWSLSGINRTHLNSPNNRSVVCYLNFPAANSDWMLVLVHQVSAGLADGHTPLHHSHDSLKIILPCLIVALNKALGKVSLDCTCFLLPCIFIKKPDGAAGAPLLYNVRKDCKGKHMWPTSFHQIKYTAFSNRFESKLMFKSRQVCPCDSPLSELWVRGDGWESVFNVLASVEAHVYRPCSPDLN